MKNLGKLFLLYDTTEEVYNFLVDSFEGRKINIFIKEVIEGNSLTLSIEYKIPGNKLISNDIKLPEKKCNPDELIKNLYKERDFLKESNRKLEGDNKILEEEIRMVKEELEKIKEDYEKMKEEYEKIKDENELKRILLHKKFLFKNEQDMEFITYSFEGFIQNVSIISDFKEKIKILESLTSEEKASIDNLTKRIDYKIILFNLQSLLLYFNNERSVNGNEILSKEIKKLSKGIISLHTDFINIFKNTQLKDLKLNKLISFYEYIEFINFDKILRNVPRNTELSQEELKERNQYINAYFKLEQEQIDNLNKHFENENELLINELWNDKIISEENEDKFEDEMDKLARLNIKTYQSINLYENLKAENIKKEKSNKIKVHKKKSRRYIH
eukprot:jgi/Orpsp1_1/1183293/evm.model.c7180000084581.1